jgi:hypothetical protein
MEYKIIQVTKLNINDIKNNDELFKRCSHIKFEGFCDKCGNFFQK